MRKIYTRLVIDIETLEVIEEDSYLYDGPVAECKGDVNVPPPPGKSDTEKAIDEEYLASLRDYRERLNNPEKYMTETEKLLDQYSLTALQGVLENYPEQQAYQQKTLDYMNQLIDYNTQQLQNVQTIKELSSYTGELTAEERATLDQVAQNSINKITSSVNEETADIVGAKIASLVDKGVLNSTVGTQLLAKVAEQAQKIIGQGATDIETARLQQELGIQQENKNRALQWANVGLNQQQIMQGLATQNYSTLNQPLVNASQISNYAAGLRQQYGNMSTAGMGNWLGAQSNERMTQYQGALQAAIEQSRMDTELAAAKWGAFGNVVGMGAAAGISKMG